jgi:hypothetical protein
LKEAVTNTPPQECLRRAEELYHYVMAKTGGFEFDGWKFRGPAINFT